MHMYRFVADSENNILSAEHEETVLSTSSASEINQTWL